MLSSWFNLIRASIAKRLEHLRYKHALFLGGFAVTRRVHLINLYARLNHLEWVANKQRSASQADMPKPEKRGVVFLHNCYYNFFYLAKALRNRGWDALSVSIEDPNGENAHFYHGNDVSLYDPSPERLNRNIEDFFGECAGRFRMLHFYGRGHMAFNPSEFDSGFRYDQLPFSFLSLKQAGIKIGYSVCGCLDGVSQTSVHRWSGGACERCVWQHQPQVCNDRMNLAWGHKFEMFCDLIATEGFPALDYQSGPKVYREPLTTALDPNFWRPDLEIPEHLRLQRKEGELIVYHAVGNFQTRSQGGRNLKGTGAVVAAVKRLQAEGMNVRLEFVTNLPNTEVRFIQAQADVIVDQLNYGRYGATAREGMMLGRPTVCYLNRAEPEGQRKLELIETCPLVSATEATIYDVLRDLLIDSSRRRRIGIESRAFAIKWHSADACAERFEEVYDRLMKNMPPELAGARS